MASRLIRTNMLDERTWLAKFLRQTEDRLTEDAGGPEQLSNVELMEVRRAAALWVEWQLVTWHRQQSLLKDDVSGEGDKYYFTLVNSLGRALEGLGTTLKRGERKLPALSEYLAAKTNGNGTHAGTGLSRAAQASRADTLVDRGTDRAAGEPAAIEVAQYDVVSDAVAVGGG